MKQLFIKESLQLAASECYVAFYYLKRLGVAGKDEVVTTIAAERYGIDIDVLNDYLSGWITEDQAFKELAKKRMKAAVASALASYKH